MSISKKRHMLIGAGIVVLGAAAFAATLGVRYYLHRSTSVKSNVTAFLLDDRGEVNGLMLASGDQVHFSPETGAAVASQIKLGDEVTATGHGGKTTAYGREFRAEEIAANGNTIVEAEPGPPRPDGPRGPHDRGDRPGPPDGPAHDRHEGPGRDDRGGPGRDDSDGPGRDRSDGPARGETPAAPASTPAAPVTAPADASTPKLGKAANTNTPMAGPIAGTAANANNASSPKATAPSPVNPPAPLPVLKASGTIGYHLVNGRGDVDGLILSSGEQVHFSPRIGEMIIAAEQGAATPVTLEGPGLHNERGTIIRPTQITVGTKTIALGRE